MDLIYHINEVSSVASDFWKNISGKTVIAFHGVMGAGKTTFIHALCDLKNVKDVVGSPTFSIINEYFFSENGNEKKIFHIDLYRLKNEEEAVQAGIEDCIYSDHVCFIEWPEKIPHLLPENTIHVYIDVVDEKTRRLRLN